ncbi:MAG: DegT/DnrJ/EryC1/StrS family aminotransferase [Candidatus Sulfotelmatobacter sp.]
MSSLLQETETEQTLKPVEADLLRQTGGVAVQWYGRAATALYRAYQIARKLADNNPHAEVILPSISCATPANTALLAEVTPRFADVDAATGMPTLETIQQRWTPRTCAVVFIHLFGQTADLRALSEWCHAKKIVLIEDLAQALGACLPDGSPAGSVGDMSVYSFNPTKILECGGGGLAVRSPKVVELLRELPETDPSPSEIDEDRAKILALSYRNLHHSLVALLRTRAVDEISTAFLNLQPAFRSLYLQQMKNPAALLETWGNLPKILEHRARSAALYDSALSVGNWQTLSQWRESGVCWRYSLLVNFPDQLVTFSEAVRRDGFHVSNLYWPVNDFFRPTDLCPEADRFARRIVNLWVDPTVDPEWVAKCAKSLLKNAPPAAS